MLFNSLAHDVEILAHLLGCTEDLRVRGRRRLDGRGIARVNHLEYRAHLLLLLLTEPGLRLILEHLELVQLLGEEEFRLDDVRGTVQERLVLRPT